MVHTTIETLYFFETVGLEAAFPNERKRRSPYLKWFLLNAVTTVGLQAGRSGGWYAGSGASKSTTSSFL